MQSFIGENPFTASSAAAAATRRPLVVETRGRGGIPHPSAAAGGSHLATATGEFEMVDDDSGRNTVGAQKSVEGWVVIVTNIHEEAQEDDIVDAFSDFGVVSQCHLNLDRRTGFAKGYALVEFRDFVAAKDAIKELTGAELLGKVINVDWAFMQNPIGSGPNA